MRLSPTSAPTRSRAGRIRGGGSIGSRTNIREDWTAILEAGNARPPLALRVNRRVTTRDALIGELVAAGVGATAAGDAGILVDPPRPVVQLPGYAEGAFSVQDLGAQLAAPLLRVRDGHARARCLRGARRQDDAYRRAGRCRARRARCRSGASRPRARQSRPPDIRARRGRYSSAATQACPRHGGTVAPSIGFSPTSRAPRRASSRRHPDGKWLRRESDVDAFVRVQARLLAALWPCLARGGAMLYATCSIFGDENEASGRGVPRKPRRRVARNPHLRTGHRPPRRTTLAFAPRREPQSGRFFLRAAAQDLSARVAVRTPPSQGGRARIRVAVRPAGIAPRLPHVPFAPFRPRRPASAWARHCDAGCGSTAGGARAACPRAGAGRRHRGQIGRAPRRGGWVFLNAEFDFTLNPTLDEALQKGVPLYFLLEFELVRPRWYWLDEKVLTATTQYRVSYNALTRQYRASSGLLGQTFESLDEVERFLSRVTSRAGGAAATSSPKACATTPSSACASTSTSCPSHSSSPRSRRASGRCSREWYRWSYTP